MKFDILNSQHEQKTKTMTLIGQNREPISYPYNEDEKQNKKSHDFMACMNHTHSQSSQDNREVMNI